MDAAAMHPALQPIGFLLGRWRGEGEGGYPTINSFKYGEEVNFFHNGKPAMAYAQKTWKAASGEPMHAESGFWRPQPDGKSIDIVIAQSTGMTEVEKGVIEEASKSVTVESSHIGNATKVTRVRRTFRVEGDVLHYEVDMETTTQPMQRHLTARLHKQS